MISGNIKAHIKDRPICVETVFVLALLLTVCALEKTSGSSPIKILNLEKGTFVCFFFFLYNKNCNSLLKNIFYLITSPRKQYVHCTLNN